MLSAVLALSYPTVYAGSYYLDHLQLNWEDDLYMVDPGMFAQVCQALVDTTLVGTTCTHTHTHTRAHIHTYSVIAPDSCDSLFSMVADVLQDIPTAQAYAERFRKAHAHTFSYRT